MDKAPRRQKKAKSEHQYLANDNMSFHDHRVVGQRAHRIVSYICVEFWDIFRARQDNAGKGRTGDGGGIPLKRLGKKLEKPEPHRDVAVRVG